MLLNDTYSPGLFYCYYLFCFQALFSTQKSTEDKSSKPSSASVLRRELSPNSQLSKGYQDSQVSPSPPAALPAETPGDVVPAVGSLGEGHLPESQRQPRREQCLSRSGEAGAERCSSPPALLRVPAVRCVRAGKKGWSERPLPSCQIPPAPSRRLCLAVAGTTHEKTH